MNEVAVESLGFTVRTRNTLKRNDIYTLDVLVSMSMDELLAMPNFGITSLGEVLRVLAIRGLSLNDARVCPTCGRPIEEPSND